MATATKKNIKNDPAFLGGVPYGNLSVLSFPFEVNSSGIFVDSDQTTAIADGDIIRLGILPAGLEIVDYMANIYDTFASSTTMAIGFKYVDGVDSAAVPEDADYFCAATTMATAARLRMTNTAITKVKLPKDAYLTLLSAGAAQSSVGKMLINVIGVLHGQP